WKRRLQRAATLRYRPSLLVLPNFDREQVEIAKPCGRWGFAARLGLRRCRSGDRTLDAVEQIIHLVQERIEIVVGLADDDLAFVVLQRTDIDRLFVLEAGDRVGRGFACRIA